MKPHLLPILDWIDRALGPFDELLLSRLITGWRENVWRYAAQLLDADEAERARVLQQTEGNALRIGQVIYAGPGRL